MSDSMTLAYLPQNFTPMQRKFLELLSDGQPHTPYEFLPLCKPSGVPTIRGHMRDIRAKLRPAGQDILCVYRHKKFFYQHVRLINRSE